MKHVCNTCLDQDICPDAEESVKENRAVAGCDDHKERPVCTECATLMKRVGITEVIFCPNCGQDNREDTMKRELEREEPLQLNEEWFLSLDSQDRGKELVQIINMILRGQHYTNEALENVGKALHDMQANSP